MLKKELIEKVTALAAPIVESEGFTLWHVDYYKDPQGFNLLIEIDKKGGISFEDLSKVNDRLNKALDEADYIKDSYSLEVSSAGLERELRKPEHVAQFVGSPAKIIVKLYAPKNGVKQFEGKLAAFDGEALQLDCGGNTVSFTLKETASIKAELFETEDY